jgi:hypothetical protein
MPKCPKCGREINSLLLRAKQMHDFRVYEYEGGLEYFWIGASSDDDLENEEYYCPKCGAILFTNDIDALNFLKGNLVI